MSRITKELRHFAEQLFVEDFAPCNIYGMHIGAVLELWEAKAGVRSAANLWEYNRDEQCLLCLFVAEMLESQS